MIHYQGVVRELKNTEENELRFNGLMKKQGMLETPPFH